MEYYADRWELFFNTIDDNGGKCNDDIVDKYKHLVETQVISNLNISCPNDVKMNLLKYGPYYMDEIIWYILYGLYLMGHIIWSK